MGKLLEGLSHTRLALQRVQQEHLMVEHRLLWESVPQGNRRRRGQYGKL